jgi:hypothetical protein
MSIIQTRKIEIELPENMYNVLAEMAVANEETPEQTVLGFIHMSMECELTGGGDMGEQLSKYLCRRHGYDPSGFRKEK